MTAGGAGRSRRSAWLDTALPTRCGPAARRWSRSPRSWSSRRSSTFYLLLDWDRDGRGPDSWMPLRHRETVRGSRARSTRRSPASCAGRSLVCLILGALLRHRAVAGRPELRLPDRAGGRPDQLHPLCRLADRPPGRGRRRGRAVLAGLEMDPGRGRRSSWSASSSKAISWRPSWSATSVGLHPVWMMFALFAFGYLFGFVGLLVAVPLAAAIGVLVRFALRNISRARSTPASRAADADRRTPTARPWRPRQLALALDHAESLAREDFLGGPSNAAALALIERWPDWPGRAVVLGGPEGSGKSHLAAIWARAAGARRRRRALAGREPTVPAALATGALVVEDLADGGFDERGAVSPAQSRARGAAPTSCSPRAPRRPSWRLGDPRPRLAAPGAAGGGAGAARRRAAARGPGQAVRRPPARGRREPGRLPRDPHRALVRGGARGGGDARPRGAAPAAAGDPGAGGRSCCAASA